MVVRSGAKIGNLNHCWSKKRKMFYMIVWRRVMIFSDDVIRNLLLSLNVKNIENYTVFRKIGTPFVFWQ